MSIPPDLCTFKQSDTVDLENHQLLYQQSRLYKENGFTLPLGIYVIRILNTYSSVLYTCSAVLVYHVL